MSLQPLSGLLSTADIALPDRPAPPPDEVPQAHLRVATAEYFDAAGIRCWQVAHSTMTIARWATGRDRQPHFAARHWPGETAIGKAVQIVQATSAPRLEIVGVVSDVQQFRLDAPRSRFVRAAPPDPCVSSALVAARMYWVVRGTTTVRR